MKPCESPKIPGRRERELTPVARIRREVSSIIRSAGRLGSRGTVATRLARGCKCGYLERDMAAGIDEKLEGGKARPGPRVLHVVDADHVARFGRMYRQLGLALADAGVQVSILTDDAHAAHQFEGTPIAHHWFPALRGWGAWRLHRYLRNEFNPPPEVVHLWGTTALGYLSDWTQHGGIELLIHATSRRDVEQLLRRGLHHNEQVLAGCRAYQDRLRSHPPMLAEAVLLHPPALLRPERLPELTPPGRTVGVLWTGRMERGSGVELIIDAMAQLRNKDYELHVALIGRGSATRDYWRALRARKIQERFSLVPQPQIWDRTIGGVDVLVAPACHDELGLAPLLAMALGKIVIASRDQVAEWFVEDETSLQFTPGSAVELAAHLAHVAARLPSIRAMARNAADYVRRNHAVTTLAEQLALLYENSIRRGRALRATASSGTNS